MEITPSPLFEDVSLDIPRWRAWKLCWWQCEMRLWYDHCECSGKFSFNEKTLRAHNVVSWYRVIRRNTRNVHVPHTSGGENVKCAFFLSFSLRRWSQPHSSFSTIRNTWYSTLRTLIFKPTLQTRKNDLTPPAPLRTRVETFTQKKKDFFLPRLMEGGKEAIIFYIIMSVRCLCSCVVSCRVVGGLEWELLESFASLSSCTCI